jgi:hypothetical protein
MRRSAQERPFEGFAVIRTDIRTIVKSREQVCEPD